MMQQSRQIMGSGYIRLGDGQPLQTAYEMQAVLGHQGIWTVSAGRLETAPFVLKRAHKVDICILDDGHTTWLIRVLKPQNHSAGFQALKTFQFGGISSVADLDNLEAKVFGKQTGK